jgi:uncharacterized membrane protein (UPF0127 family)
VVVLIAVVAVVANGDDGGQRVASRAATTSTAPDETTTAAPTTTTTGAPVAAPSTTSRPAVRSTTPTTTPSSTCPRPAPGSDFESFGSTEIVIQDAGGPHRSCTLTADNNAQWQRGLMAQDDLDGYAAMIVRFPSDAPRSFWMRNTRIPLSIAFFDGQGRFVSSADMAPCGDRSDCPSYRSEGPAQFALEVPQGGLAAVGAGPGSRLSTS